MDEKARDFGLLILRLSGLYLAWGHGWDKVVALSTGKGEGLVGVVGSLGFPRPELVAWAPALAELIAAALVLVGLFTRWASFFCACDLAVAAFMQHHALRQFLIALHLADAPADMVKSWGRPELAILYLICFSALLFLGAGRYSVDATIRDRREGRRLR